MKYLTQSNIIIEAMQVPDEGETCSDEMSAWLGNQGHDRFESSYDGVILVHTPDGTKEAGPGDWIVKDQCEAYHVMKPDKFQAVYRSFNELIFSLSESHISITIDMTDVMKLPDFDIVMKKLWDQAYEQFYKIRPDEK